MNKPKNTPPPFGTKVNKIKTKLLDTLNNKTNPQDLQKETIKRLFSVFKDSWNALILDKDTHKIIYILFNNEELREYNIVNIYLLENNRYKLPASAIYFINTTPETLPALISDLRNGIYEEYNYIFLNYLNKDEIKQFTNEINKEKLSGVNKVFDGYLDYFMIQKDMFSSEIHKSMKEPECTKVVNSLFSLFFTLNTEPLITGNEQNNEVHKIKSKLVTMFKNRDIIKSNGYMKTLLILIDRREDLISPIKHNWTYNGLLHDLYNIEKGRVVLNLTIPNSSNISKSADTKKEEEKEKNIIFTQNDEFWQKNSNLHFPQVAENIDKAFKELKTQIAQKETKMNEKKKNESLDLKTHLEDSLRINNKKEYISNHMSLCLKTVETIKKRGLDDFYTNENIPINKINEQIVLNMSTISDKDFLRFAAILICNENLNDNLRQVIYAILNERKIDYSFITALIKEYKSQPYSCLNEVEESPYRKILSGVLGNIKELLIENFKLPISETVNEYLNKIVNEEGIEYENVEKIVVYQIGGGTFLENEALRVLEKKIEIPILYGMTEVLNFESYYRQILDD
ncbi:SEC1 family transport protein SLY1 [Cucumispora dikerogammari]|nr:SEC1 family transport protein SLY1 [Cucumispora dikerogammari]